MGGGTGVIDGVVLGLVSLPSTVILLHPFFIGIARRKWHRLIQRVEALEPAVSIVVPFAPTEEHAARNMDSLLRQQGLRDCQVIFVVEDPSHPSAAQARAAAAAHPEADVTIVCAGDPQGRLAKMHNLQTGLELCRHDLVVFVDSDVEFRARDEVHRFVAALGEGRVGLVTAAPTYREPRSRGGYFLATMVNADLWAYFACLYLVGALNVANGAVLAARRSFLGRTGDLGSLQHQLLNDTALARRVRAAGGTVVLSASPASVPTPALSLADGWRQVMRWHVGMRRVLPATEYLVYGYHRSAMLVGALAFLLADPSPVRPWFVAIPALARLLSGAVLCCCWRRGWRAAIEVLMAPLTDLLSPVIWLLSWMQTTVEWRGRTYSVGKGGVVQEVVRG